MIKCIFRKLIPNKTARTSLTAGFIVLSAVFVIGPLFIKPEISTVVSHNYHRNENRKYKEELHRKDFLKYNTIF